MVRIVDLPNPDREQIMDGVISSERLITLLHESAEREYALELQLEKLRMGFSGSKSSYGLLLGGRKLLTLWLQMAKSNSLDARKCEKCSCDLPDKKPSDHLLCWGCWRVARAYRDEEIRGVARNVQKKKPIFGKCSSMEVGVRASH